MKDDHVAIILGRIEDKLARFAEMMADVPHDIAVLKEDVANLKEDVRYLKSVNGIYGRELNDHQARLVALEMQRSRV